MCIENYTGDLNQDAYFFEMKNTITTVADFYEVILICNTT